MNFNFPSETLTNRFHLNISHPKARTVEMLHEKDGLFYSTIQKLFKSYFELEMEITAQSSTQPEP